MSCLPTLYYGEDFQSIWTRSTHTQETQVVKEVHLSRLHIVVPVKPHLFEQNGRASQMQVCLIHVDPLGSHPSL